MGTVGTKAGMGVGVEEVGEQGSCLLVGRDSGGVAGRSGKNQWQFSRKVSASLL